MSNLTRAQDGHWYINDNGKITHLPPGMEGEIMAQKLELARAIVATVQQLAPVMDMVPDIVQEYFDSGITFADEDVAALGLTAAQVVACITMLDNATKFFSGGNPTNAQYRVSINAVRRAK